MSSCSSRRQRRSSSPPDSRPATEARTDLLDQNARVGHRRGRSALSPPTLSPIAVEPLSLPSTQEITGSNPVGGTYLPNRPYLRAFRFSTAPPLGCRSRRMEALWKRLCTHDSLPIRTRRQQRLVAASLPLVLTSWGIARVLPRWLPTTRLGRSGVLEDEPHAEFSRPIATYPCSVDKSR